MERNPKNVEFQKNVLLKLEKFIPDEIPWLLGYTTFLVKTLERYIESKELLNYGCRAVRNLCQNGDILAEFVQSGVLDQILAGMGNFKDSQEVQMNCCMVLGIIGKANESNRITVLECGTANKIFQAMKSIGNQKMVICGLDTCAALVSQNNEMFEVELEYLKEVPEKYNYNPEVCCSLFNVLFALAKTSKTSQQTLGVVETVTKGIDECDTEPKVLQFGFQLLEALAPDNGDMDKQSPNLVGKIFSAIQEHHTHDDMKASALSLLAKLAEHKENRKKVTGQKSYPRIITASAMKDASASVIIEGFRFLAQLCRHEKHKSELLENQVVTCVKNGMVQHASNIDVQLQAVKLIACFKEYEQRLVWNSQGTVSLITEALENLVDTEADGEDDDDDDERKEEQERRKHKKEELRVACESLLAQFKKLPNEKSKRESLEARNS